MSEDPELRQLLAPMIEREVELVGEDFRVDRERVLSRMAQAKVSERRGSLSSVLPAAAGVLLLVLGVGLLRRTSSSSTTLEILVSQGSVTQSEGATRVAIAKNQSTRIAASGELETAADSQASLRTQDGLQIELQSQTRVALGELQSSASQVKLLGGAIRCSVPHRSAQHTFQVVTADVTVVDLGTVFTVSIEGPDHVTRVSVEEGEVMVHAASGQTRVQAPSSWSSAQVVAAASLTVTVEASSVPPNAAPEPSAKPAHSLPSSKPPPATLEQEAQLLRQGLAAERQGRSADAVAALRELLAKYPHSPLAPDARSALARVEASSGQ